MPGPDSKLNPVYELELSPDGAYAVSGTQLRLDNTGYKTSSNEVVIVSPKMCRRMFFGKRKRSLTVYALGIENLTLYALPEYQLDLTRAHLLFPIRKNNSSKRERVVLSDGKPQWLGLDYRVLVLFCNGYLHAGTEQDLAELPPENMLKIAEQGMSNLYK